MPCKKLDDFDKENPNYQKLVDAINNGTVILDEDKCVAFINAAPLKIPFGAGMSAYLGSQGYASYVHIDVFFSATEDS